MIQNEGNTEIGIKNIPISDPIGYVPKFSNVIKYK